jgi:hypothetical protein
MPETSWADKEDYDTVAKKLKSMFDEQRVKIFGDKVQVG